MNWRRLADVLLRRPTAPDDERVVKGRQLDALEREASRTNARIQVIRAEAAASAQRFRR